MSDNQTVNQTVNVNIDNKQIHISDKKRLPALLLCFFIGVLGIHRFYVGKIGTGIIWILTAGVFGIGVLVDFIMIICGTFKDKYGRIVEQWT